MHGQRKWRRDRNPCLLNQLPDERTDSRGSEGLQGREAGPGAATVLEGGASTLRSGQLREGEDRQCGGGDSPRGEHLALEERLRRQRKRPGCHERKDRQVAEQNDVPFIGNKVFDIKKVDAQPGSSSAADNERYVVGLFPNYEDSQRNLPLDSHPGNPLNAQPKKEEDVVVDEPTKSVEMLKEKIQKKQKMEEEKAKEKKEVKVIPATKINPEHERTAKIRLEEERLRALQRRESRKKRGGYERPVSMSQAFLESENSGDDLAAIKDRYKYGKFDLIGASSSEESSGDERRLDRAKRSDSEDSDVETRDKAQTKKKIVEERGQRLICLRHLLLQSEYKSNSELEHVFSGVTGIFVGFS
ncbi:hypothetical protein L596_024830 [Steinernema carpocapsae]|uniref:Uncharacterized protein n=1 Tax=Steinernema carpocapsae TaxID=34508 RepID=A0A4V6XVR3_STECR|nr:hypothetical protein L596_024830 [Steinernema carpocapsae]